MSDSDKRDFIISSTINYGLNYDLFLKYDNSRNLFTKSSKFKWSVHQLLRDKVSSYLLENGEYHSELNRIKIGDAYYTIIHRNSGIELKLITDDDCYEIV
jgi:hypothetical protein